MLHVILQTTLKMYSTIFRAGFTSKSDLDCMRLSLDNKCVGATWIPFTVREVYDACRKLKPLKKDADLKLDSSALINTPAVFYEVLCLLINSAVVHGCVPSSWRLGTIIPLLKASNLDKYTLSSYRPITLSSLFCKVFDNLISS
jgi:hypothetical protein